MIFIFNLNQLTYPSQTKSLLNSSPLDQTSKKNKTDFFTLRSAPSLCLAPLSGFKIEKSIKKHFISNLFIKYKTGLTFVTGLCVSASLYCSKINPMEPGIIALNTLTGIIAYLFADLLSQKINEKI